jgi:hypothetical protein
MFVKYTKIFNSESNSDKGDDEDGDDGNKKRADTAKHREICPISILRQQVDCTPGNSSPTANSPAAYSATKTKDCTQSTSQSCPTQGRGALASAAHPSKTAPQRHEFMPRGWIANFNLTIQTEANFCSMHWSISAALCPVYLRANIPRFLDKAANLMIQYSADCGWFTDIQFLLDDLDQYMPRLRERMPHC